MLEPLKVVYITSLSYSGSTLLDLTLGSHSRIVGVGELKGFSTGCDECSCDASTIWDCAFWTRVGKAFSASLGIPLSAIRLASDDDCEFVAHNRALFEAIRKVSGKSVIVDSSKSTVRLARLLETDTVHLLPIHLIRPPQAVVYSSMKRRRSLALAAFRYGRRTAQIRSILRRREHRVVRYEELARRPELVLRNLVEWIGLSFEPAQLRWAARERHNFGGNPMRTTTDSTIRPDTSWRTGLAVWQRAAIAALELTGRLSPAATRLMLDRSSPPPRAARRRREDSPCTRV